MELETLIKLSEDEQKGYFYGHAISLIARSEKNVDELMLIHVTALHESKVFVAEASRHLLEIERNIQNELIKYKTKIENGDFDKPKLETEK